MREKGIEISTLTPETSHDVPNPGSTFSTNDILKVITGELEGHYWTSIETGEIVQEGTLQAGDKEMFNHFSRGFLAKHHDWCYGGRITEEQARELYRGRLFQVWQDLYK